MLIGNRYIKNKNNYKNRLLILINSLKISLRKKEIDKALATFFRMQYSFCNSGIRVFCKFASDT